MNFIYNWSDEDFTYKWDNKSYTIKAGDVVREVLYGDDGSTRTLIVPGISQHFAKHLAQREMMRQDIDLARLDVQEEYIQRALALPSEQPAPKEEPKEEVKEEVKEAPKKKTGRPKKKVEEPKEEVSE
jgi:hypothetical protein